MATELDARSPPGELYTPRLLSGISQEVPYSTRLQYVLFACVLSSLAVRLVQQKTRSVIVRLLFTAPVVFVNLLLPYAFDRHLEILSATSVLFAITWLASFKALAACWDRGPLVGSWTLPQFIFLYFLPVYPRQVLNIKAGRMADEGGSAALLAQRFVLSVVVLIGAAYFSYAYPLPAVPRQLTHALGLYAFISFMMTGVAALSVATLNLELIPGFDAPWQSNTVGDFWAKRWNITTSSILRTTVYDPIVEGSLRKGHTAVGSKKGSEENKETGNTDPAGDITGHLVVQSQQQVRGVIGEPSRAPLTSAWAPYSKTRKTVGVLVTFCVSGLAHEMILFYLKRGYRFGYWFWFFAIQGPICIIESRVLKWAQAVGIRQKVPGWMATLMSVAVLEACAYCLFFPAVHPDVSGLVVERVVYNGQSVLAVLRQWTQQQ